MHTPEAMGFIYFLKILFIKMTFCPTGNSYIVYRNPKDMFDTQIIKLQDMGTGNIYIGKKCVLVSIID